MKSSNVLTEAELQIYLNELNSPRLRWLTDNELMKLVNDTLKLISILTGSDVYEEDWQNELLELSIKNLITTSDEMLNLTVTEFTSAFYLNQNGAFDKVHAMYGKPISAEYIGNVQSNYRQYKKRSMEKQWAINRVLNPPPVKEIPKYTAEDYKGFIQTDYELYKSGHTEFIFLIFEKYFHMRRWKMIIYPTPDMFHQWYNRALQKRENENAFTPAKNDAEKRTKKKMVKMYKLIRETSIVPPDEHVSVVHMMRKMVYLRMLEKFKEAGIVDIFKEVACTKYDESTKRIYFELKKK